MPQTTPPNLAQAAAFSTLTQLAQKPLAPSSQGVLTPERIRAFQCHAAGWNLQFWGQRVDKPTLSALTQLAEQLQLQTHLQGMMDGKDVNHTPGHPPKPALHTASRALFADLPWPNTPSNSALAAEQHALQQWHAVQAFVARLQKQGWNGEANAPPPTDLIHIGIGGSHLGVQACYKALGEEHIPSRRVHFLSSAHPDAVARITKRVNPKHALLVAVTKSGTSFETILNLGWACAWMKQAGVDPQKRLVWVSAAKPPQPCLEYFPLLDDIGGRYSLCSTVGTLSLSFALGSACVEALLRGARLMDLHAQTAVPQQNLPLLMALFGVWNRNFLQLPGVVVTPYHPYLGCLIGHFQQLEMESNGKQPLPHSPADNTTGYQSQQTGAMLWGGVGENSQHAFMQWLHQGSYEASCEILAFRQANTTLAKQHPHLQQRILSNALAQALVLSLGCKNAAPAQYHAGDRPHVLLTAQQLTPLSLGALLALYEHKTVLQGFAWGINPFNQAGVEQGKITAKRLFASLQADQQNGKENNTRKKSDKDTVQPTASSLEEALCKATELF